MKLRQAKKIHKNQLSKRGRGSVYSAKQKKIAFYTFYRWRLRVNPEFKAGITEILNKIRGGIS